LNFLLIANRRFFFKTAGFNRSPISAIPRPRNTVYECWLKKRRLQSEPWGRDPPLVSGSALFVQERDEYRTPMFRGTLFMISMS
jgi:hypothetical protein